MVDFNGVMYGYVHNLQGDIVAIVNGSGTVVVSYTYDAWGKPLSKTGTLASTLGTLNPFRYRGYVYDEETGLYYLRSRYYNSLWCRFCNTDTVLLQSLFGKNTFCYSYNCPIIRRDPDGFSSSIANEIRPACIDYGDETAPASLNPWRRWGCGEDVSMPLIDVNTYVTYINPNDARRISDAISSNAAWATAWVGIISSLTFGMYNGIAITLECSRILPYNPRAISTVSSGLLSTGVAVRTTPSSYVTSQFYYTTIAVYDASVIEEDLVFILVNNSGIYDSAIGTDWNLYNSMPINEVDFNQICNELLGFDMIN